MNIQIIGVPEGEEEEQEIENLFEKIMKEDFPHLVKEIDNKSRKHKESQTSWTPTLNIIKMPKVKDKEKILKAARE